MQRRLACAPQELTNTDWHTPLLYDFLPELGIPAVQTALNRYVVDPNRDAAVRYGDFRRAAVAASTPWGVDLYDEPPDETELDRRLALGHAPYHAALDRLLEHALARHERVLLLDLHSFGVPLDTDVVVGDGKGTTASARVRDLVVAAFEREGFDVAVNRRFTGGWIVRRFAGHGDLDALIVELHYSCYLRTENWPGALPRLDAQHLDAARERVRRAIAAIVRDYDAR